MNENTRENIKYYFVMAIVRGLYMPATLFLSFSHIVELGHMTGLTGRQAFIAPFLIDGFALIGMVLRTFADEATRRFGLKMQITAMAASFAANIAAGNNAGERAFGAAVVIAFIVAERAGEVVSKRHAIVKAERAATLAQVEADRKATEAIAQVEAELAAKRSAAASKAAATRARKAATAKREAAEDARVAKRILKGATAA